MKKIKAKFEMSLWQRIKAASIFWWAIVITKEIEALDDETIDKACDKLGVWMSATLEDDKVCEEMKIDIRNWFKVLEGGE